MKTNILILIVSLFCIESFAYGYLDPGTGSYVIQILVAMIAGAGFAIKIYWGKIRAMFSKEKPQEDNKDEEDSTKS